jgi:hypothetical protein
MEQAMKYNQIPRITDIPFSSTNPIQFVYQSTATAAGGLYQWTDNPSALAVLRPLIVNSLYLIEEIYFAANVSEENFCAGILPLQTASALAKLLTKNNAIVMPQFQMYLQGAQNAPLFREAIAMPCFLRNFPYPKSWVTGVINDQLLASWNGTIAQAGALLGVATLTLTATVSALEIQDQAFIELFNKNYPKASE